MMPDAPTAPLPQSPFAYLPFRLFWIARICSILALQIQIVATGWRIYDVSGSAMALGFVGLAEFLPAIALILVTGHVADRFDRRFVIVACQATEVAAMALLGLALTGDDHSLLLAYAAVVLLGTGRAFEMPASSALVPNLVPTAVFPRAVAVNSSAWQATSIIGPAVGGLLYGFLGNIVFAISAGLFALAGLLILSIRITPRVIPRQPVSLGTLLAGIAFIRRKPIVLGAISLDLFAVLLGGATALLPVLAKEQFHAGAELVGMLRAAPGVGALTTGIILSIRPLRQRVGPILYVCVALFGLGTIVFGLTSSVLVACVSLVVMGAADMVSVYVRQTLVQLETPDEMRGRVSAVNGVFIGASNQLGEFESGVTAAWLGASPAVVLGGIGTLVVVVLWARLFPQLLRADRL
ncbi:MFS transporter [Oleisolibacter albus]|uniref:MFS transporter n=1 Tax=Oleisolibacter albus TaxID=2171757 RepID=UPI001EFE01E4|nr:MFS transporter [Oleisolibacter albus]